MRSGVALLLLLLVMLKAEGDDGGCWGELSGAGGESSVCLMWTFEEQPILVVTFQRTRCPS